MFSKNTRRLAPLAAIAALFLAAAPASADVSRPPWLQQFSFEIPAAESCEEFDLGISGTNGKVTQITFNNGKLFRVGKGVLLTYTNLDTGKTYTVNTAGTAGRYTQNPDGTWTFEATGHTGFVYFSTDVVGPGQLGPQATQYTGRLLLTIDSPETLNVLSVDATSGKTVDICAALS